MPSDDYAFAGGGALKLKGAKVKKHKKKKEKSGLETVLATGDAVTLSGARDAKADPEQAAEDDTIVERREKKPQEHGDDAAANKHEEDEGDEETGRFKTDAERQFKEAKRKKLLQLSSSAGARPELFKTHKQRVEELNTYLSKLSEHHDMPKIGPG